MPSYLGLDGEYFDRGHRLQPDAQELQLVHNLLHHVVDSVGIFRICERSRDKRFVKTVIWL